MFEAFKKLKLASAFLGCATSPQGAKKLSAADIFGDLDADKLETFGGDIDAIFESPGVAQLYENGYMPPPERPAILLDLPEETLGYQLGCYLKQHKLTIEAPGAYDHGDRVAYIRERVRMLHPLVHVLTMYDASPLGELAVQAFFVGQFGNLASGTILAAGLLRLIQDTPQQLGDALQLVAEAFERGRGARNVLAMPWEELFPAPSGQIRDLFGLSPRTSDFALLDMYGDQALAPRQQPRASAESLRKPEPEPEPEPEPVQRRTRSFSSSMSFGGGGSGRPKTRWAGLDHLSDAEPEPAPAPAPEPEPRTRAHTRAEPSGLALALSEHSAKAAAAKAERTAKAKAAREAKSSEKASPLAGFFEAASTASTPSPPPAPEPPQLDLRGPPRRVPPRLHNSNSESPAPLPSRTEAPSPQTTASKIAAAEAKAKAAKAKAAQARAKAEAKAELEAKTKPQPTAQTLPKPGDRDYF